MQWADKAIISPPLTAQVYLITQSLPLSWHQHMMQSDSEQRRAFSQPASWRHLFPNQTSEPNLLCCLDSLSEEWGERSVGWNRNGFCGVNRGLCECLHVWAEQKGISRDLVVKLLSHALTCLQLWCKSAPQPACAPQHPALSCCRRQPSRRTAWWRHDEPFQVCLTHPGVPPGER